MGREPMVREPYMALPGTAYGSQTILRWKKKIYARPPVIFSIAPDYSRSNLRSLFLKTSLFFIKLNVCYWSSLTSSMSLCLSWNIFRNIWLLWLSQSKRFLTPALESGDAADWKSSQVTNMNRSNKTRYYQRAIHYFIKITGTYHQHILTSCCRINNKCQNELERKWSMLANHIL